MSRQLAALTCPQAFTGSSPPLGLLATSPLISKACLDAVVSDKVTYQDYFNVTNALRTSCIPGLYPTTTDGYAVTISDLVRPFRTPLDQKARFGTSPANGPTVSTDCSILNNTTYCPSADGCTWQSFIVGNDEGICNQEGLGVSDSRCNCTGMGDGCRSTMSLCMKTRADPAFLTSCCLGQWPLGISHSVPVSIGIATSISIPIMPVTLPNGFPDPLSLTNTITNVNPFQLACDPSWCPGSAACDSVVYQGCAWSVTTIDGSTTHAMLAPTGACGEWYRTFTSQGILGTNSFALIDSIVNEYCIKSASQLNDDTSCACVNPQAREFYTWYSPDGITSNTYQVSAVNSNSYNSIAVSDYVCSNPYCIAGFQQNTSFITSGLLARKTTCPTQICMQVNLGLILSATTIEAGGYVNIGNTSLICTGTPSIAADVPLLEVLPFTDVWFYNGVTGNYYNPDNSAQFVVRNLSPISANVEISIQGLPDWLRLVTLVGYEIGALASKVFILEFLPELAPGPVSLSFDITVTALDGGNPFSPNATWTANMAVSIVDVSIQVPEQPLPPKPRTDNSGQPLTLLSSISVGGLALVVLSACMILFSLFLMFNNIINANASH